MLAFTKEAVHEVVAAKVSQIETCGHQSYLLHELQLNDEQLEAINRGCGLGPFTQSIGATVVAYNATGALCDVREVYLQVKFVVGTDGKLHAATPKMSEKMRCCALYKWKRYANDAVKLGPKDERALLGGIVKTLHLRPLLVLCFAIAVGQVMTAQESTTGRSNCTGLHAGITAEFAPGYTEPSVMVTFVLLNDAEVTRKATPESWKLIIDGKELQDSGFLFGNGPMPSNGYESLAPGATFTFGMAISLTTYFPEKREHTLSWKGRDFQSPTVTFRAFAEKQ